MAAGMNCGVSVASDAQMQRLLQQHRKKQILPSGKLYTAQCSTGALSGTCFIAASRQILVGNALSI